MKESSKNYLVLKAYPSSLREEGDEKTEYSFDYGSFKELLRDFSKMKIDKKLTLLEENDFKDDLLKNEPEKVILFVEKSLRIPLIHPFIFMILFEALKVLLAQEKISKEKYFLLCDTLIKERNADISRYYDLKKLKIHFLSV